MPGESPHILVIGYGNPGRGDDAAGWLVAEAIERQWGNAVEVQTLHQLDVVIAEQLSDFDLVVFVDAEITDAPNGRSLARISPSDELQDVTHTITPQSVLGLGRSLYNVEPEAYLTGVYGHRFDFGAEITKETARDIKRAVSEINRLIESKRLASTPL